MATTYVLEINICVLGTLVYAILLSLTALGRSGVCVHAPEWTYQQHDYLPRQCQHLTRSGGCPCSDLGGGEGGVHVGKGGVCASPPCFFAVVSGEPYLTILQTPSRPLLGRPLGAQVKLWELHRDLKRPCAYL